MLNHVYFSPQVTAAGLLGAAGTRTVGAGVPVAVPVTLRPLTAVEVDALAPLPKE